LARSAGTTSTAPAVASVLPATMMISAFWPFEM
jgi:hypothetical protein